MPLGAWHAAPRERECVHTRTWTNEQLSVQIVRVLNASGERGGGVLNEVTHRHMLQKLSSRDLRKIFTSDFAVVVCCGVVVVLTCKQHRPQCSPLDNSSA